MKSIVICSGIKANAGSFNNSSGEAVKFDSTTFYLNVDLDANGKSKTIGNVSRPFKFGDSTEFEKWAQLEKHWPPGGLPVDVEFGISAGASDGTKLVIKSIKPHTAPAAKVA